MMVKRQINLQYLPKCLTTSTAEAQLRRYRRLGYFSLVFACSVFNSLLFLLSRVNFVFFDSLLQILVLFASGLVFFSLMLVCFLDNFRWLGCLVGVVSCMSLGRFIVSIDTITRRTLEFQLHLYLLLLIICCGSVLAYCGIVALLKYFNLLDGQPKNSALS
jgi:hypothetical protein